MQYHMHMCIYIYICIRAKIEPKYESRSPPGAEGRGRAAAVQEAGRGGSGFRTPWGKHVRVPHPAHTPALTHVRLRCVRHCDARIFRHRSCMSVSSGSQWLREAVSQSRIAVLYLEMISHDRLEPPGIDYCLWGKVVK